MPKPKPKPQARGLADGLRESRLKTGLSATAAARKLGWSQATVSRIETGRRNVSAEETAAMLAVYGVIGDRRDALVEMAQNAEHPSWLETRYAHVPHQAKTLAQYESESIRLVTFELILVTGLLQTPEYIRALMNTGGVAPTDIEARVGLRLERQKVLDRPNPPHLVALMDEAALHRTIGGRRVMAEQLRHVLKMAKRPGIELRVIPFDHGGHAGIGGSYVLVEFDNARPVVHLEHKRSGVFLSDPKDVHPYIEATASLAATALNAEQSAQLVSEILGKYQRE